MVRLNFIGLFTLSHGGNRNQQGGRVPLMWPAALCSGLAALSCGWAELWTNLPTLKKKKDTEKDFLARWMWWLAIHTASDGKLGGAWERGYVQSLPEWAWTFVSVVERQRAILEDGHHHTAVWQRYCRKLTFRACRPRPILC